MNYRASRDMSDMPIVDGEEGQVCSSSKSLYGAYGPIRTMNLSPLTIKTRFMVDYNKLKAKIHPP